MKHYLLEVIVACVPDQKFGQDAIEWALLTGRIVLTGDKEADVKNIMRFYDDIIEAYRRKIQEHEAMLLESYAPLFEEIAGRRIP